jgi:hypothetical protein
MAGPAHPRRTRLPAYSQGLAGCTGCGRVINLRRAFPLVLACHAAAQGVFCLRCYEVLALTHVDHVLEDVS